MNLIAQQAEYFFKCHLHLGSGDHKEAISQFRNELYEYRKIAHKIIFSEEVINQTKVEFDAHYAECENTKKRLPCSRNIFYENALFFMQNELEDLNSQLSGNDFSSIEKESMTRYMENIIEDLKKIQLGQQMTYDDFRDEFKELQDLYFLNKKHWSQLFIGKVTEMVASGIISESVSKNIVDFVQSHLPHVPKA